MTQPKSKKDDIFIGTVLICFSVLLLICGYLLYNAGKSGIEPIVINQNEIFNNEYKGEINEFMLVAQRFAKEHTYNVTDYNCVNYTEDLKAITDELGFKTKKVIGCRNETINNTQSCHEWLKVELDFEPQTAKFVDFSKEYPQQEDVKNKEERKHPTQKPVPLGRWLIKKFANLGDKIFDPFAGSGSFLVACKQLGFEYVGCEINKLYVDIANQRLSQKTLMEAIL